MIKEKSSTTAQLRHDTGPAASPLGTDDEAAGSAASADRIAMAREAEQKIGDAAHHHKASVDAAHSQRDAGGPYSKEEHMNEELAKRKRDEREPS